MFTRYDIEVCSLIASFAASQIASTFTAVNDVHVGIRIVIRFGIMWGARLSRHI